MTHLLLVMNTLPMDLVRKWSGMLLLSLVSLPGTLAAGAACPVSTHPGTCVTGLGYRRLDNVTAVDDCCAACVQDAKCVGFDVK